MKKNMMFAVCMLFAASAMIFTSCDRAEEPAVANQSTDEIGLPQTRATVWDSFRRVVYVEVNDVNPLNAGEYLCADGTPFFTDVILFASNIRGDAAGNVHNFNNPNNAAILGNPAQYIAPLRAKGIRVIMGNLGDHTGAGFANLTASQITSYVADLVAYENIVDGYDFDDEWAEYGTRGYPYANDHAYGELINALNTATTKQISIFDWGWASTLGSAVNSIDFATFGSLNGYGSPSFSIPLSRYCPYFCNLSSAPSDAIVKARTQQAMTANAGGVTFFNLPMQPTMTSKFNAAAQAFGKTVTHTGTTYSKNY